MPIPLLAQLLEGIAGAAAEQFAAGSFSGTIDFVQTIASGEVPTLRQVSQVVDETYRDPFQPRSAEDPSSVSQSASQAGKQEEQQTTERSQKKVIHLDEDIHIVGYAPADSPQERPASPEENANKQPKPTDSADQGDPDTDGKTASGRAGEEQESSPTDKNREKSRSDTDRAEALPEGRKPDKSVPDGDARTDNNQIDPGLLNLYLLMHTREGALLAHTQLGQKQLELLSILKFFEEEERKKNQQVIDAEGRIISLWQHEQNETRRLFLLTLEIHELSARSFGGAVGVFYGRLLTNDSQKIRAWGQTGDAIGNLISPPKSSAPTAPRGRTAPRDKMRGQRKSKKGKQTNGKRSKNARGAYLGKNGRRFYKGVPQPGMRGPIKLRKLGNGDPDFYSTGASFFDSRLPFNRRGEVTSDYRQFKEAMKDLKKEWKRDKRFKERFTKDEQKRFLDAFGDMSKEDVISGKVEGFTWHHSTDAFGTGRGDMGGGALQLLESRLHDANKPHFGGRFLTGGDR